MSSVDIMTLSGFMDYIFFNGVINFLWQGLCAFLVYMAAFSAATAVFVRLVNYVYPARVDRSVPKGSVE